MTSQPTMPVPGPEGAVQRVEVHFLTSLPRPQDRLAEVTAYRVAEGWVRDDGVAPAAWMPTSASALLDRWMGETDQLPADCAPKVMVTDPNRFDVTIDTGAVRRSYVGECDPPPRPAAIGSLVLRGHIANWDGVPLDLWPQGVELRPLPGDAAASLRSFSAIRDERRLAITSASEFEGQWLRASADITPKPALPPVDFSRDMVLMAAMGTRSSTGYAIAIDRVAVSGDVMWVHLTQTVPGRMCAVGMAMTYPITFAVVPRFEGEVRWTADTFATDCG